MNAKRLYTLKEIAEELNVNYRTLLSCKERFGDYIQAVPVGRMVKYSGDLMDFFKLVFALLDEGYSTDVIKSLLLNGVDSEKDAFAADWLESWREKLRLKQKKPDDTMTGGPDERLPGSGQANYLETNKTDVLSLHFCPLK